MDIKNLSNDNSKIYFEGNIILLGDSSVGKTSILECFSKGFVYKNTTSTVGVDYKVVKLKIKQNDMQLKIWDTSGQERFRSLAKNFYHLAQGVIFVYDVTSQETFDQVEKWIEDISEVNTKEYIKVLVGNKVDQQLNVVSVKKIKDICEKYKMQHFQTSAILNQQIKEVFEFVAQKIYDKFFDLSQQIDQKIGFRKSSKENKTSVISQNQKLSVKISESSSQFSGKQNENQSQCCTGKKKQKQQQQQSQNIQDLD